MPHQTATGQVLVGVTSLGLPQSRHAVDGERRRARLPVVAVRRRVRVRPGRGDGGCNCFRLGGRLPAVTARCDAQSVASRCEVVAPHEFAELNRIAARLALTAEPSTAVVGERLDAEPVTSAAHRARAFVFAARRRCCLL